MKIIYLHAPCVKLSSLCAVMKCFVAVVFKGMTRRQKIMHAHSKPDDSSFLPQSGISHSLSPGPGGKDSHI